MGGWGSLFRKPIDGQNKYFTLTCDPLLSFNTLYEFSVCNKSLTLPRAVKMKMALEWTTGSHRNHKWARSKSSIKPCNFESGPRIFLPRKGFCVSFLSALKKPKWQNYHRPSSRWCEVGSWISWSVGVCMCARVKEESASGYFQLCPYSYLMVFIGA